MAGVARDADVVERGARVADAQPVAGRLRRHHPSAQDIGARVRTRRPTEADDQHGGRYADLHHRCRPVAGRQQQPHAG